jgi:putative FmdB family regulatory protein
MPIYEYECRACRHEFEALVRLRDTPSCPKCQSADLERKISLFAVESDGTRRMAINAARQRHAKASKDKVQAEIEYDRKLHDDHDH